MHKLANSIKNELAKVSRPCTEKEREFVKKYLGTRRKFLNVKSADRDRVLWQTLRDIKSLPSKQIVETLNELLMSDTFEFVNFAGKLLAISAKTRENIDFEMLERWLRPTSGWAECDGICQSLFRENEVLDRLDEWQKTIIKFSNDQNIQLRRASLVLQVKPGSTSSDPKLRKLAYRTIDKRKSEKKVLITKAISWLLRSLSRRNPKEVLQYLEDNIASLPAIAYRETMRKITTGKK